MASSRVCVISYDWYPHEVRALRSAEAAVSAGYDVDVICLRQSGKKRYEIYNGVRIYRLSPGRCRSRSLLMTLLYWCYFLLLAGVIVSWLHLKQRYNVVHVHNMPDFLVFSAFFPKLLGAKIILDVQDVSPELMASKARGHLRGVVVQLARWQERISTVFAHHIVTTGPFFEALLIQRGVPQEKITSILNSADPKLFPQARRYPLPPEPSGKEQPFIVMYHGTVAARHGLDTAIRALALVRQVVPYVRLDIQGSGDHLLFIKQLVTELDLDDSIVFTGPCPPEKVVDFVVHGHVGIIPYQCDGFADLVLPTKAYEFAWMHRAMIASDTRAIRSMFRPESIILCDASSPEGFAEAIVNLYYHPEKRASMIDNAYEDYLPYRWELMAERYQRLLKSLICTRDKTTSSKELLEKECPK